MISISEELQPGWYVIATEEGKSAVDFSIDGRKNGGNRSKSGHTAIYQMYIGKMDQFLLF